MSLFSLFKSHHPLRHARSFKYAANGIYHALLHEPNFRVQIVIAFFCTILGLYFKISEIEWGLLVLTMGFMLSAELLNTVVEEFIDFVIPEESDVARIIKDVSAGFVLITSFATLAIILLIFLPRMFVL